MLVGCFRIGSSLVHEFLQSRQPFSVIDFNPAVRDKLARLGVPCLYGDISHLDTLEHAGVEHARILIVPITDDFLRGTDNETLLQSCRQLNPKARVVVVAESLEHALALYEQGADYVIVPRVLAAAHTAEVVRRLDGPDFAKWREAEIAALRSRHEVIA